MLLYGPPGNGKTSAIRTVANAAAVNALVLRPGGHFDDDDFDRVLHRWKTQAPAILVLEDLNDLLRATRITLGNFLNRLDGIGTETQSGLMIIATTNHPEELTQSVSCRPGRFDVLLEFPPPDRELRRRYLCRSDLVLGAALISELVDATEGLSFAHLDELLRIAGFRALSQHRAARDAEDLRHAAQIVCEQQRQAMHGFPAKPNGDFGFARAQRPGSTQRELAREGS
ncbi:MAG: ATP-binding protein [Phycisphaeraceae bacterium]